MSHQQAYHTSSRTGVSGISGFQINAATPGLDREQLAALSAAHARYEPPHDAPFEPTPEQMRAFPVSLRASVVPGVGRVVSRTEYVGREYRGRNGAPDEGRFGNYFCHMVVGDRAADPFDGCHPIELWDAPHWTTTESADPTLPELGRLQPGSLDLARVVAEVSRAPKGVPEALVDAAMAAVAGGPPLLVLDPDPARAVVWLAWIVFALPRQTAHDLAFSTYEGRPQDVLNLHVMATTPACDPGIALTSRFTRVEATVPAPGSASLYARAVARLAQLGADPLADAVRTIEPGSPAEQGAALAIAAGVGDLVGDEDLVAVLRRVGALVAEGSFAPAAATVAALTPSAAGDAAALPEWIALHAAARAADGGDTAREVASVALGRIVDHLDAVSDETPQVPASSPTAPAVASLGAWLRAAEAAKGTDRAGRIVTQGLRLGLVGVNVPVDARVAAVLGHDLGRPAADAAIAAVARQPSLEHVLERLTTIVLEDAEAGDPVARLLPIARHEAVRETVWRRAQDAATFDAQLAWQRLRVGLDQSARPDAARVLAALASDNAERAAIRALWGRSGPQRAAEMKELIGAYVDAGEPVPPADVDRACRILMQAPLPRRQPPEDDLGWLIGKLPPADRDRPELWAWAVGFVTTAGRLERWSERARRALEATPEEVPDERWEELVANVAAMLLRHRDDPQFGRALEALRGEHFPRLCAELGRLIGDGLERSQRRLFFAADEFAFWLRIRRDLVDDVLPLAFERLSAREVEEIAHALEDDGLAREWEEWAERHPRAKKLERVTRALGLGGGRRREG